MGGPRRVLVKLVLYQSEGRGNFQKDTTTSFTPDSKIHLCNLSNDVSIVPQFFLEGGENKKITLSS